MNFTAHFLFPSHPPPPRGSFGAGVCVCVWYRGESTRFPFPSPWVTSPQMLSLAGGADDADVQTATFPNTKRGAGGCWDQAPLWPNSHRARLKSSLKRYLKASCSLPSVRRGEKPERLGFSPLPERQSERRQNQSAVFLKKSFSENTRACSHSPRLACGPASREAALPTLRSRPSPSRAWEGGRRGAAGDRRARAGLVSRSTAVKDRCEHPRDPAAGNAAVHPTQSSALRNSLNTRNQTRKERGSGGSASP